MKYTAVLSVLAYCAIAAPITSDGRDGKLADLSRRADPIRVVQGFVTELGETGYEFLETVNNTAVQTFYVVEGAVHNLEETANDLGHDLLQRSEDDLDKRQYPPHSGWLGRLVYGASQALNDTGRVLPHVVGDVVHDVGPIIDDVEGVLNPPRPQ